MATFEVSLGALKIECVCVQFHPQDLRTFDSKLTSTFGSTLSKAPVEFEGLSADETDSMLSSPKSLFDYSIPPPPNLAVEQGTCPDSQVK